MLRAIFLACSSRRAGSFRWEKTKPRLCETSRYSSDWDSKVYEIPRFLIGTKMCSVRDLRCGRDLVRTCRVRGVTNLKTQNDLSSRTLRCWNWVRRDTDASDQSKFSRILEMRGQLWVSFVSSSWKLVSCWMKRQWVSDESRLKKTKTTTFGWHCFKNFEEIGKFFTFQKMQCSR